jgi:hypothetical protein
MNVSLLKSTVFRYFINIDRYFDVGVDGADGEIGFYDVDNNNGVGVIGVDDDIEVDVDGGIDDHDATNVDIHEGVGDDSDSTGDDDVD